MDWKDKIIMNELSSAQKSDIQTKHSKAPGRRGLLGLKAPDAAKTEIHGRNVSNANDRIRARDDARGRAQYDAKKDAELSSEKKGHERQRAKAISLTRTGFGKHPDSAKKGFQNSPLAVRRHIPNTSLSKRQATAIRRSQDLQAREPKPTSKLAEGKEMNWQDKIYESLTETRSAENRRKVRLRKTSAEQEKREAAGKSLGAYGAGTRARREKALAKKASKPDYWHARRHHEGEAERLIAHGKRLASNKKGANKFLKRDETKANLAKLTIRSKAQNEGTGYRRRWLGQASRDDDITSTEAGTIDAAMYAKVWKDTKGQKRLTKRVAKTIAKRREKEKK